MDVYAFLASIAFDQIGIWFFYSTIQTNKKARRYLLGDTGLFKPAWMVLHLKS